MPDAYEYSILKKGSIRVLELHPAKRPNDPLKGNLLEVELGPKQLYETLSYVWGARTGDRLILCNGKELYITENCESALRQLRFARKSRTIWVDAICINQTDELEKNKQVGLMDEIYKNSTHLRIWLGEPESSRGLRRYWMFLQSLIVLNKPLQWIDKHMGAGAYTFGHLAYVLGLLGLIHCK
jgi:hypothetical protein